MHGQDGNAGVDDVHAVLGHDVGDGAAAARVDAAELAGLEVNARLVHDVADEGHVLGVGVVGAALAAAARVFVKAQAATHKGCVLGLELAGVARVKAGGHVRGEHAAAGECAAQGQRAALAGERHDFGDGVLEETARHAGGTHGADLLLVDDERDARALDVCHVDLSEHGGVGADAVVVAIAQDHGAVETHVAGGAGGHDLDLGREEVLLLDVVLFLEDVQEHLFDGLLGGVLVVLVKLDGAAAHDHVEDLGVDGVLGGLGHLLAREVDQQVGDGKDRIVGLVADVDVDGGAVLFADDAYERERGSDPVVALDAAIVVRVEISHVAGLEGGVLLKVQARRVNVGAQDVKALLERGGAQVDEHEVLAVIGGVHLVAGLERASLGDHSLQVDVSRLLGHLDTGLDAQALGLVLAQKLLIAAAKLLELLDLLWRVLFPCAGTLHDAGSFRIDRAG